jgi:hypothetical protein
MSNVVKFKTKDELAWEQIHEYFNNLRYEAAITFAIESHLKPKYNAKIYKFKR